MFAAKASRGQKEAEVLKRICDIYAKGDSTLIAGAAYGEQRPLLLPKENCVLTGQPLRIALVMSGRTPNADASAVRRATARCSSATTSTRPGWTCPLQRLNFAKFTGQYVRERVNGRVRKVRRVAARSLVPILQRWAA